MKYRNFRIAWSVAWGLLAVLLCVLWVRSNTWCDVVNLQLLQSPTVQVTSAQSYLIFGYSQKAALSTSTLVRTSIPADDATPIIKWAVPTNTFGCHLNAVVGGFTLELSYRLLTVLAFGIATAIWFPLKRFSLRNLLIATTLVTVVLGLLVYAARK